MYLHFFVFFNFIALFHCKVHAIIGNGYKFTVIISNFNDTNCYSVDSFGNTREC